MCRRTLCTLFAVLALLAATAWADSQIRIVRLSYVEGDVQLDEPPKFAHLPPRSTWHMLEQLNPLSWSCQSE